MKSWLTCVCSALLLAGCATSSPAGRRAGLPMWSQDAAHSTPQTQPQTQSQTQTPTQETPKPPESESETEHGVGHALLWYIPNRISDVLDIVRARLRLGPGLEIGVRATELLDLDLGGYSTIFVGIPGPRRERKFNWPFGVDNMAGVEISVIGDTTREGEAPHYGVLEVGLGAQILIIGFDLGVDVWEAVDFVTGIVFVDPMQDDI